MRVRSWTPNGSPTGSTELVNMSKLSSLPLFHQIAGQPVLVLGEGDAAQAKRRLVERAGGIVETDSARAIDEGVRLAFIAFEDARACEVSAINLRCAGLLVNVVDQPDLCDFTTPSVLDRNPVLIAVGTGGASAGLAKHVRLRLERILPPTLGKLADALSAARSRLRERYADGASRRRAIDEALREGGALDAFDAASHEHVESWLDASARRRPSRTNRFVLSSFDPDDLTLKQARELGEADVVCADPDIPSDVLTRARADALRYTCGRSECRGVSSCPQASEAENEPGLTVILHRVKGKQR